MRVRAARGQGADRVNRASGEALLPALQLIPSRLAPPSPPAGAVKRAGLVGRLRQAQAMPVIAIVAPAGYGKTTLLAQWAAQDSRPFAWLTFDWRCNDPAVLFSHLAVAIAAVVPVEPAVFQDLAAPHPPERLAVLAGLASALSGAPHPFVLVLDDVHLLTDSEGLEALSTLTEQLPRGSQLAAAARQEPQLGLARLRAEGKVLDIGRDDLRLDVAGARDLLSAAGVRLPARPVAELVARTEGWAVGVYFAALAHNAGSSPGTGPEAFGGDDRLVTDYMRAEFLGRLPADDLRFLTRTSVLDELSGPLCDAVAGRRGSAAVLERLEASNLLLVPLDRQRRWYRYHQLFQEMLRHELERREPGTAPLLALRACDWCAGNGLPDGAIHYAQLAGDTDRVNRILLLSGIRLHALGRAAALRGWFAWLAEHGSVDGGTAVLAAWLSLVSGRAADAQRWAAVAGSAPPDAVQPDGSPLKGWVQTVRAAMASDVPQMRTDARDALQFLAPGSQLRPTAAALLGTAELLQGDLHAADAHLADAAELGAGLGARPAETVALATRAIIAIRRDRWEAAQTLLERAASVITEAHLQSYSTSALTHAVTARVAMHLGDARAAREHIQAAERLLPLLTRALAHLALETRLELVRAYVRLGEAGAAQDRLDEMEELLRPGSDFGSLREEAGEMSATVQQTRASAAEAVMLTAAELRLLPFLATQLSFREIAEQLFVSVHTVRAQVTSIYRKLGVSSRTQAIDRARDLGLIPG